MAIIPLIWGIPPAPRGVPQIEVTFDIDANGTGSSEGLWLRGKNGDLQGIYPLVI